MLSKKLLTVAEAASYLGSSVPGIEWDLTWGHIPFHLVDGKILFDPADFMYDLGVDFCSYCQLEKTMFCKHC